MAHHSSSSSSGSTSGTRSGYGKVLKDFILGGTSGAIAKTLAAPLRESSCSYKPNKTTLNLWKDHIQVHHQALRHSRLLFSLCQGRRSRIPMERKLGQRGQVLPNPSYQLFNQRFPLLRVPEGRWSQSIKSQVLYQIVAFWRYCWILQLDLRLSFRLRKN